MALTGKQIENILNNEAMRYLFLVSLISADTLVTENDCNNSLQVLNFIKDNVNIMNLSDEVKIEVMEYAVKGISIVSKEIEQIKGKNGSTNKI